MNEQELRDRIAEGNARFAAESERIWHDYQRKLAAIRDRERLQILLAVVVGIAALVGPIVWQLIR